MARELLQWSREALRSTSTLLFWPPGQSCGPRMPHLHLLSESMLAGYGALAASRAQGYLADGLVGRPDSTLACSRAYCARE